MNVIDTSTNGFLEILSNVVVAQEISLSLTYERPDESCSGCFTLMYFGKRRARRKNFFWSRRILADDCVQCCHGRKRTIFENWSNTLFVNFYLSTDPD